LLTTSRSRGRSSASTSNPRRTWKSSERQLPETRLLKKILELRPDLVFLDMEMPGQNGLAVARSLRRGVPVVIFVTAYETARFGRV